MATPCLWVFRFKFLKASRIPFLLFPRVFIDPTHQQNLLTLPSKYHPDLTASPHFPATGYQPHWQDFPQVRTQSLKSSSLPTMLVQDWIPSSPRKSLHQLFNWSLCLLFPFQSLSSSYLGMPLKHKLDPVSPLKTFPPSLPPSLSS